MRAADVVVFYLPCITHENKEEHKKSERFVL